MDRIEFNQEVFEIVPGDQFIACLFVDCCFHGYKGYFEACTFVSAKIQTELPIYSEYKNCFFEWERT